MTHPVASILSSSVAFSPLPPPSHSSAGSPPAAKPLHDLPCVNSQSPPVSPPNLNSFSPFKTLSLLLISLLVSSSSLQLHYPIKSFTHMNTVRISTVYQPVISSLNRSILLTLDRHSGVSTVRFALIHRFQLWRVKCGLHRWRRTGMIGV